MHGQRLSDFFAANEFLK